MVIYVWPNGNWIYDWEISGFTMQHSAVPEGGRWIDVDNLGKSRPLSKGESMAISEALGDE